MKTIPGKQAEDLDLHALRVLDVLFRERSLTRAAESLHTQQPALSKTLARLRRYFGDPLFVRSGCSQSRSPFQASDDTTFSREFSPIGSMMQKTAP